MSSILPPLVIGCGFLKGLARLVVLLLSVIFYGFSVSGGQAQDAGGGLAAPGDLKMKLSALGMGGVESWIDPGTWGALLITKEQANELNQLWDKALAAYPGASDDEAAGESEKQAWNSAVGEFRSGVEEILTPAQIELREAIKKMAYTMWVETAPSDGSARSTLDFRPQLEKLLETLLSQQQLEGYRSTSGKSPTGSSVWTE